MNQQLYLINQATFADYEDISVNVDPKRINACIKRAQDLDLKPFMGQAFYFDFIQWFEYSGLGLMTLSDNITTIADGKYLNIPTDTDGNGIGATVDITILGGFITAYAANQPGSGYAIGDEIIVNPTRGDKTTDIILAVAAFSPLINLSINTPQPYADLFLGSEYEDLNGHNIIYDGIIPALVYWTFARFIEVDQIRYTTTGPVIKHHDVADPVSAKDIAKLVSMQRSIANAHANNIEKFLWDNTGSYPLWKFSERNKNSRQPGPRIRGIDRTQYNGLGYANGYNNSNEFGNIIW